MDVTTIPVPTTEAGIGTLRVPIPADDPLLADALVASASIISDFEDQYLNELTDAVEQSLRSIRQMVIGRLRARATIVTPIAASAAEFMNPWHDELGQFAPKGYGTDRPISHSEGVWSVEAADGSKIEMNGDGADELTDEQRSEALNAVADVWDLAPLDRGGPPRIEVHASDHHPIDLGTTSTVIAWVHANEDNVIHLIGARAEWDTPYETHQPMPSESEVSKIRYTATHEYGHLFMYANEMDEWHNVINLFSKREVRNDLSEYGRERPTEAYAEAFAEYFGTAGSTHNAAALRFAADLGWRKELPNRGMAAAMPGRLDEIPVSIYETATGPIFEYVDGTIENLSGAVVASSGEFANPWHDEIGRFAPKGTGVKRLGPKTLNDKPTSYEQVNLLDQEAVKRSLEAYADTVTERINEMRPDEGLELALADIEATGPPDNEYMATFLLQDETGDIVAHMDRHIEFEKASVYAAGLQVDDDLQGHGIGTVLQESFEDWAAAQDLAAMKVYAIDVGRYAWMRAGYDWANTDGFHEIANLLGQGNPAAESFRRSVIAGEVLEETPTPYELTKMLSRDEILSREFPNWDGIKPLRTRALAAAATAPREERLAKVRDAWKIWAREFPAAAEGYIVDPEAEAAWAALMGEEEGLVAAGPFDLDDFNVMTPEEWAAAFDVEAADIVGDVVVDAATGQALRPGLNVSDQIITDLIDRHIGRLQGLGPLVQASVRDALHLAVRNQLTLDEVIREIQATGPLGETAARAIARTELTAATNGGMLTGWRRDGFPFKSWVSLHDDRVRHAHLEADGQVVPTEQEFEVGGFRAMYPGDPRLPVHLRINCRCYMDRIGEDGQTLSTRLVDSTRAQLYRIAQELNIPGRSKMRKDDLFQAIDRYRNGFGYTSLEEMNRAQLLIRARAAGIVGRSRMTKPELMIRLRALATGRNRDRWLIDAGHGTREQLVAVQAQLREDLRVLIEGPIPAIIAAGAPPTVEKIDIIRRKVFRRYGGADTGTAMCVGCGARLHWSNSTRWEQLTLIRLNSKVAWSSKNAMPVCLACAPKLAKLSTEKLTATFTIDSWEAVAEEFWPGWSKILGQFSTG